VANIYIYIDKVLVYRLHVIDSDSTKKTRLSSRLSSLTLFSLFTSIGRVLKIGNFRRGSQTLPPRKGRRAEYRARSENFLDERLQPGGAERSVVFVSEASFVSFDRFCFTGKRVQSNPRRQNDASRSFRGARFIPAVERDASRDLAFSQGRSKVDGKGFPRPASSRGGDLISKVSVLSLARESATGHCRKYPVCTPIPHRRY